jgi:hypothetical protein
MGIWAFRKHSEFAAGVKPYAGIAGRGRDATAPFVQVIQRRAVDC